MAHRFCLELTPYIATETWDEEHEEFMDCLLHVETLHELKTTMLEIGLTYLNRDRMIDVAQCS